MKIVITSEFTILAVIHLSTIMKNLLILIICLQTAILAKGQTNQNHRDSLNQLISSYYNRNIKVFQSGSSVEDIDRIFDLFTDDFTYVPPYLG